ncbi:VOC family protein [Paractinoplanes hotanensis]|uniref:VOC family protein n=1 Tax=Paractinoplanes hotanensis TaxID=2906497 RepID=A0ABT0Y8T4_9ACTN|nr:VOC family protein [Actinoplanes hotanensis]MCM4082451.1 VOC family protein [Actinoplanes hotanensis]
MDMKLEVVVVPVADVDRAKEFYTRLGWRLDADFASDDGFRVVQVTPPGSPASIIFGSLVLEQEPGSAQGLHLVVSDIDAAHDELKRAGAEPSEVFHDAAGVFHRGGTDNRVTGPDPNRSSYGSYLSFSDPDGNGWVLQEVTNRLPGRVDPSTTAFATTADLAAALRRAAAAHGEHEKRTGAADPDWPDWYADYMVKEQAGAELPR